MYGVGVAFIAAPERLTFPCKALIIYDGTSYVIMRNSKSTTKRQVCQLETLNTRACQLAVVITLSYLNCVLT